MPISLDPESYYQFQCAMLRRKVGAKAHDVLSSIFQKLDARPEFSGSGHGCIWKIDKRRGPKEKASSVDSRHEFRYSLQLRVPVESPWKKSSDVVIFSVNATEYTHPGKGPEWVNCGFFVVEYGDHPYQLDSLRQPIIIEKLRAVGFKFSGVRASDSNLLALKLPAKLDILVDEIASNFNGFR